MESGDVVPPSGMTINVDYVDRNKLILIAFISNLGALLLGYDIGVTSTLLLDIRYFAVEDSGSRYYLYVQDSDILLGLIASGAAIGAVITYVLLLFFGNSVSKKDEILQSSFLLFIGALLESFSSYLNWKYSSGLVMLIFGRLIFGAGVATTFHAAPQYVSEMAPPAVRGNLGSATEVMVSCGVLLGYCLGFLSDESDGWAGIYLIGYIIALVMGVLTMFIPHSPKWMALHNFPPDEILESLQFLYPNANDDKVIKLRKECQEEVIRNTKTEEMFSIRFHQPEGQQSFLAASYSKLPAEVKFLIYDTELNRCLLYGLAFVVLNMGTGNSAILYYAGDLFDSVCDDPDICVVGLGLSKLLPAIMMSTVADYFGRRTLLITGTTIVTIGLTIITAGYGSNHDLVVVGGMYVAMIGWEVGFGTMVWFIINELFPQFVRPAGISILSLAINITSTVIVFSLPSFISTAGFFGAFLFFTCISVLSFFTIYGFQPETQGVDLEQGYKLVSVNYISTMSYLGFHSIDGHISEEYNSLLDHEDNHSNIVDTEVSPVSI
jgi:MFS transporter, SP family, galactose:H+ symporter